MNTIHRAYKFRLYPTPEQAEQLAKTFGCARFVFNHFLRVRTDGFFKDKERIGYNETARRLTLLKRQPETVWLCEVSNVVLQQSLRNLDTSFQNFFQKRAKYPSFKSKHGPQSARYTSSGFRMKAGELWLAKMSAPLDMRWSRKIKGEISSVSVSKDASGRYFASLLSTEEVQALPVSEGVIGMDLGLKDALITSDGQTVPNPKFFRKAQVRLARAQRSLCRKKKGSKNRAKARLKVARIHAKVVDSRKDWSHKLTTQLIRENQVISAESLQVKNMVKNHCLAKAIHDVGWTEITRQLEYKAKWYGRTFVQIDRFYPSSKRCSCCGHTLQKLDLATRQWTCPECGTSHDRDINAAINIREAGLAILAGAEMLRSHEKNTAGLAEL